MEKYFDFSVPVVFDVWVGMAMDGALDQLDGDDEQQHWSEWCAVVLEELLYRIPTVWLILEFTASLLWYVLSFMALAF